MHVTPFALKGEVFQANRVALDPAPCEKGHEHRVFSAIAKASGPYPGGAIVTGLWSNTSGLWTFSAFFTIAASKGKSVQGALVNDFAKAPPLTCTSIKDAPAVYVLVGEHGKAKIVTIDAKRLYITFQ
jgi:hypothetical protein